MPSVPGHALSLETALGHLLKAISAKKNSLYIPGMSAREMGERDTVGQELGYDGLCNYAQRITSCFGLDGLPESQLIIGRMRPNGAVIEIDESHY
ncbi:hypothetical protein EYF80_028445 [Liparis tanakae]|uniref:Uncharacterized protein n=1 Tax=Liparis tanakae TaxID=230148 RepID=A0A4Z2H613_9TELE|nr:hypothetical protein EYF80_028445 [Liparis tanakae]